MEVDVEVEEVVDVGVLAMLDLGVLTVLDDWEEEGEERVVRIDRVVEMIDVPLVTTVV